MTSRVPLAVPLPERRGTCRSRPRRPRRRRGPATAGRPSRCSPRSAPRCRRRSRHRRPPGTWWRRPSAGWRRSRSMPGCRRRCSPTGPAGCRWPGCCSARRRTCRTAVPSGCPAVALRAHFWFGPPCAAPEDQRGAVGDAVTVGVEALAGAGVDDGAVGVDGPLLRGGRRCSRRSAPPSRWRCRRRRVEALAAVDRQLPGRGRRPVLVGAAVAVPQVDGRAVGLAVVGDVDAQPGLLALEDPARAARCRRSSSRLV